MIVSPNTNCPHINNLYPLNEFELVKFESLKCENCEEKNDLWNLIHFIQRSKLPLPMDVLTALIM